MMSPPMSYLFMSYEPLMKVSCWKLWEKSPLESTPGYTILGGRRNRGDENEGAILNCTGKG